MFRLLSIAILAMSASALPLLTAATPIEIGKTPSYDDAYVSPEMESLSECQGADLPVFFRQNLITSHSAEYVSQGILASLDCDGISVNIVPIVSLDATAAELETSVAQVTELQAYLEATGTGSEILSPRLVTHEDNLYLNGRAAIIRVSEGQLIQS